MCNEPEFIYKYMSFERFIEMSEKQKLYLTRIDCWQDVFERFIITYLSRKMEMRLNFNHNQVELLCRAIVHSLYAQSWCSSSVESDAMWRIYSPNATGIRVKFRRDDIYHAIDITNENIIQEPPFFVEYTNQIPMNRGATLGGLLKNITYGLKYKRLAFKHENEYRFVVTYKAELELLESIINDGHSDDWETLIEVFAAAKPPVIQYDICIDRLKEALLDPRAATYSTEMFNSYCQNRNFDDMKIVFGKSKLYTLDEYNFS